MKNKITTLLAALSLTACTGSTDENRMRQAVSNELQSDEIQKVPNAYYHWIVKTKDGSIWHVETMNSWNPDVTGKTKLFPPPSK